LVQNVVKIYSIGVDCFIWSWSMDTKPRNLIAKDLRTPKYRMRVVKCVKLYDRKKEQAKFHKDIKNVSV
jgi:hypothetical protein